VPDTVAAKMPGPGCPWAVGIIAGVVLVLAAGCGSPARPAGPASSGGTRPAPLASAATQAPAARAAPATPAPSPVILASLTGDVGVAGRFQVARRDMTFTEPARTSAAGKPLGPRTLVTEVRYPVSLSSAGHQRVRGPFPLLLFAPGFRQCGGPYGDLLSYWAGAGYAVATVDFPRTDCTVAATADEADMVNQPADMSYVLTRLLAISGKSAGPLAGLVNGGQVGAAGQSDGGDTAGAVAANTCCTDSRPRAVAVLSGAEWPPMPGRYFARTPVPMLFVQGSADVVNPPRASVQLYESDPGTRYYLDLIGAGHTGPYWGTNQVEQVVARVTLAFFDCYVLGQPRARSAMTVDGDVPGAATLASGNQPAP
jgi:predicted dienelactone hydrolase